MKIKDWRKQLVEIKEKTQDIHKGSFKRTYSAARKNIQELMDETGKVSKGKLRLMYSMNDRSASTMKDLLDREYA